MSAPEAVEDLYPTAEQAFYGCHVWGLGEDNDAGVMVSGHGRRALAALNAYQRVVDGPRWRSQYDDPDLCEANEVWVTFQEECGCTPEQHAEHTYCDDHCDSYGLPPCWPDEYAWRYEHVEADAPGALPVTQVLW